MKAAMKTKNWSPVCLLVSYPAIVLLRSLVEPFWGVAQYIKKSRKMHDRRATNFDCFQVTRCSGWHQNLASTLAMSQSWSKSTETHIALNKQTMFLFGQSRKFVDANNTCSSPVSFSQLLASLSVLLARNSISDPSLYVHLGYLFSVINFGHRFRSTVEELQTSFQSDKKSPKFDPQEIHLVSSLAKSYKRSKRPKGSKGLMWIDFMCRSRRFLCLYSNGSDSK